MNKVFVFGSNLAGFHGAGAARYARIHHGAVMGVGMGFMEDHRGACYAIPTKGYQIEKIKLDEVKPWVDLFIDFAKMHPERTFQVTRLGCGLAGFKDYEIADLFLDAPMNCEFDEVWMPYLHHKGFKFWGTF